MLPKSWDPAAMESAIYQKWLDAGYFTADPTSTKPAYSIVLPPPNVTGSLHMGHALEHTMMDALTRRKRMQGYEVLWQPGTDHAGIATQSVVEQQLAVDGKTKEDLGRELFVDKVWDWKRESGGAIGGQMRRLGDGVDWSRDRFTMDEGLSRAVRTIFKRLYDAGLIYRAERLVNWSPVLQTAISDLEVNYRDVEGELVSFRYGSLDDSQPHIVVATTRVETMLGDTAIAVHPDDERYRHLVGTSLAHPFVDRELAIVADEHVDPEFGTGAVKVTPAHDPNDFEIGVRHQAADALDPGHQGPDRRHRNAIRRHGPLRGTGRGAPSARGPGPRGRRKATLPAQRRTLRTQRRADRAAAIPAVVGPGGIAGQSGRGCGAQRGHRDSPGQHGTPLVLLGRRHARLVHLATALVGASDPDLVRTRRRTGVRRPGRNTPAGLGTGS